MKMKFKSIISNNFLWGFVSLISVFLFFLIFFLSILDLENRVSYLEDRENKIIDMLESRSERNELLINGNQLRDSLVFIISDQLYNHIKKNE